MSKIEEFKKAKRVSEMVAREVQFALGRDSSNNDKHHVSVSFTGLAPGDWSDMQFRIHASYGYYGSSSGYSATSAELGGYLATAIQKHASLLLDYAAKLAADDAEKARRAAEDEAKAVLQTTAA
jgi:hypothetical protein